MGSGRSFIVVHDFMIRDLSLSGVPLLVYAVIYGYSQKGGEGYFGSQGALAESLGASERAIGKALRMLRERGLVVEVGEHRLKNGRSTKVFRAIRYIGGGVTNCRTEQSSPERISDEGLPTPERNAPPRPKKVPPTKNRDTKGIDSKAEVSRFDRFDF